MSLPGVPEKRNKISPGYVFLSADEVSQMTTNTLLVYLAGFATACIALYAAGDTGPVVTFVLGAAAALVSLTAVLGASHKMRARLATALGAHSRVYHRRRVRCNPYRRTPPAATSSADDTRFEEIVSALVNYGAARTTAARAARASIEALPAESFDQQFRDAVKRARN
jgi:hypothetical protein